jgi:hypothetical protein
VAPDFHSRIRRTATAQVATSSGTSYTNGALRSGKTYWYVVQAHDTSGNRSAASASASATAR